MVLQIKGDVAKDYVKSLGPKLATRVAIFVLETLNVNTLDSWDNNFNAI